MEGGEVVWSFRSRVIVSRVVLVPEHFSPRSFRSSHFSLGSFRSRVVRFRVISIPGCFSYGSCRSQVILVSAHSASDRIGPCRFGPRSFRSTDVSVLNRFSPGSFRSHVDNFSPGSFRIGRFRPCRFCLGSWLYMCHLPTYLLTYLYIRLVDHFGT